MGIFLTRVSEGQGFWMLEVKTPEGLCLEYRYASRAQARFMAVIFEMGPPSFPAPFRTFFQTVNKRSKRVKPLQVTELVAP
jgi:hypothetical protein